MTTDGRERRLAFRFLMLPLRHQIAIAKSLGVLTKEDCALSDEILFCEVFKRAAANGLLAKLWDETEKRHADPATLNPFEGARETGARELKENNQGTSTRSSTRSSRRTRRGRCFGG